MRLSGVRAFLLGLVMATSACSSSNRDENDDENELCADPGHYLVSAVRSADPGTCPIEGVPIEWNDIDVTDDACGSTTIKADGTSSSTTGDSCAYSGSITLTVVLSDEIHGTASFAFRDCTAIPERNCTARFDLVYRRQEPGAGTGGV
jgi:hypothetical protein